MKSSTMLLGVVLAVLVALLSVASAAKKDSDEVNWERCIERTGLTNRDIERFEVRNDKCSLDCITKGSKTLTWMADDGVQCGSGEKNRCMLGVCVGPEDPENDQDLSDLKSIRIRIKSAHVPDLDSLPTTGESDTFITVEATRGAGPLYRNGEMICYTYVIQDNNKPKWSNFVCRPPPMSSKASLKFTAWDSDKPRANPEVLGSAEVSLDELLAAKSKKLIIDDAKQYHINVEVTGESYKRRKANP